MIGLQVTKQRQQCQSATQQAHDDTKTTGNNNQIKTIKCKPRNNTGNQAKATTSNSNPASL